MIEHVASASSSALASSGQERISYRSVKNGAVTSAGTDTVTYSGSDYNYAVRTTVPASPDGSIRVVNGQFYICFRRQRQPGRCGSTNSARAPAPDFPEAATLLRLLSPAAKFQNAGTDVIGGVRLTHLHATQVSGLPDDPTLGRYANLVADAQVRSRAGGDPDRARPVGRQPRGGAPDDRSSCTAATARRRSR